MNRFAVAFVVLALIAAYGWLAVVAILLVIIGYLLLAAYGGLLDEQEGVSGARDRCGRRPDSASRRGRFAETAIGYVHIDVCELRLAAGKLHMFLAIDRVSKFASSSTSTPTPPRDPPS